MLDGSKATRLIMAVTTGVALAFGGALTAPVLAEEPAPSAGAVHAPAPAEPVEPDVNAQIVGGHEATEEMPFIAALHTNGRFTCTASLVAAHWILTAAHCVDQPALSVRVGSLQRSSGGQTTEVTETVKEPSGSDIALLRIGKDIEADYPALGSPGDAKTGTEETFYGWGATKSDWSELAETLKYASGVIKDANCNVLGATLCTKNDGDVAGGDSGGPMITMKGGEQTIIGTCTAGHKPTDGTGFGAYSDVTKYRDWIDSTLAK